MMKSALLIALAGSLMVAPLDVSAEVEEVEYGAHVSTLTFEIGAPAEEVYQAMTGDISGWWDHRFSDEPVRFRIEAKVGGLFLEEFDDERGGVTHARVIFADFGKRLVLDGPLGFNGYAVNIVTAIDFNAGETPGTTIVAVRVGMAGEMQAGWAEAVDGVWQHFIGERLKPYVEAGCHKDKSAPCPAFDN